MMNPSNFAIGIGRLTKDPAIFPNSDGSRKVRLTLAEPDNFKDRNGIRGSQFIPYEAFIPAGKDLGVYEKMHEGDQVQIVSSIRNNNYTDKAGEKQYDIVLAIEQVNLLESKAVTEARLAGKAAAAAAAPEAAQAQA